MSKLDFGQFVDTEKAARGASSTSLSTQPTRAEVEAAVRGLPTLPALLQQLLGELRDLNTDLKQLEERISSDAALTTRVLKMANSPFYNNRGEVVAIGRAVVTLGFKTVSNLVLATSFRGAMTISGRIHGYQRNGIFRHSLASGICCQRLGQKLPMLREFQDEMFVAGLLHNVGRIALAGMYKEHREAFEAHDEGTLFPDSERKVLGIDHQEVGAMVMEHWALPEELRIPITRHHDSPSELKDEAVTLAIIAVDCYLNGRGFCRTKPWPQPNKMAEVAALLGTDPDQIRAILEEFEEELNEFGGGAA